MSPTSAIRRSIMFFSVFALWLLGAQDASAPSAAAAPRFLSESSNASTALVEVPSRFQSPRHAVERVCVASGEQVRYTIHVFDLTLYLEKDSRLWGSENTAEEIIERGPGFITLRYDVVSPFVTRERFGPAVERAIKGRMNDTEWIEIDGKLVDILTSGPFNGVGSVIYVDLEEDGIRVIMSGTDMGKVKSSALPKALLAVYLDKDASNQAFVDEVVGQLANSTFGGAKLIEADGFVLRLEVIITVGCTLALFFLTVTVCICWRCRRHRLSKSSEIDV
eukprot:TRINITY_DN20946_c0_g1_i2.p1 TRINITY_DN20946_c0_g1~~TRINITY_DN20946_c0_g1_i2.p1  ORF type:complete len:297 (-),score=61.06 TRINITY_DN20946_c0_g1_i2:298-1131(-)